MGESVTSTRPVEGLRFRNPVFVCLISYTATSEVPGITVAGANPAAVKFTPAADAEYLHLGYCRCISDPPATPDGKPTPAVITRAALRLGGIPFFIVNAGAKVRPAVPFIDFNLQSGGNIAENQAMDRAEVEQALEFGKLTGRQLGLHSDTVVIGESIPGGTTTALAVLCALGIDARFKMSSSMPENPHELKNRIVQLALQRHGKVEPSPLDAVAAFGDPMMVSAAGIAAGAIEAGSHVLLAGGTQMAAVLAISKQTCNYQDRLVIGTTSYVSKDKSSDLARLVEMIDPSVPVISCDPGLKSSSEKGLEAFAHGFVKEGVGAGGAYIAALRKDPHGISSALLLEEIEREYRTNIKRKESV